jgi:hypothetical protein
VPYTATISTAAEDVAGNNLAVPRTWSFTITGSAPDTTQPTVLSTNPLDGATGVSASSNVVATFREAMNPSSVASSYTLRTSGGAAVPATVTMTSGNTIATLNPSADLTAGATYTATITTGATDVAGNSLTAPRTWSFTVSAGRGGAGGLDQFGITQIYSEKLGVVKNGL